MDNIEQLNLFSKQFEILKQLDKKLIFKENLGDESIKKAVDDEYNEFILKNEKVSAYGVLMPKDLLASFKQILDRLVELFTAIAKQSNQDFISNRTNYINNIRAQFESFYKYWATAISIIIEAKGFLENEGIKKEYNDLMADLKKNSQSTIEEIRLESDKILTEAREIANKIETRARLTAKGISVNEAQNQFKEAQLDHMKSVRLWTILSCFSIILFIGITIILYFDLPEYKEGLIIYKTAIRITILVSIGAVATFCLKILRSSYHMYKHNQHRQRIANSMSSFVDSAITPEQRDIILTHLVESIANFGNSGLVHGEDDNINASKFVVDNLIRNISPKN